MVLNLNYVLEVATCVLLMKMWMSTANWLLRRDYVSAKNRLKLSKKASILLYPVTFTSSSTGNSLRLELREAK